MSTKVDKLSLFFDGDEYDEAYRYKCLKHGVRIIYPERGELIIVLRPRLKLQRERWEVINLRTGETQDFFVDKQQAELRCQELNDDFHRTGVMYRLALMKEVSPNE